MLAVEVHTIVTEWGTLRFRLTDFFQQRTVVGPHLFVKPRFDCIRKINKSYLYILSFYSGNFAFGKIEEQII